MNLLARIISFITNPIFILFPMPYLVVQATGYDHIYAAKWSIFSLVFLFVAGIFVIYEVKMKVFSDMDVSKREQRPLLFCVIAAITVIYLFSLYFLRAPAILFFTVLGIMLGIVMTTVVNTQIKASLHVSTLTVVVITLIMLYHISWAWLLIIPIVAWSRITIKRHTGREVVAGFFLGIVLTVCMYLLLKYVYHFMI